LKDQKSQKKKVSIVTIDVSKPCFPHIRTTLQDLKQKISENDAKLWQIAYAAKDLYPKMVEYYKNPINDEHLSNFKEFEELCIKYRETALESNTAYKKAEKIGEKIKSLKNPPDDIIIILDAIEAIKPSIKKGKAYLDKLKRDSGYTTDNLKDFIIKGKEELDDS
jgi:hypothetical protein